MRQTFRYKVCVSRDFPLWSRPETEAKNIPQHPRRLPGTQTQAGIDILIPSLLQLVNAELLGSGDAQLV